LGFFGEPPLGLNPKMLPSSLMMDFFLLSSIRA